MKTTPDNEKLLSLVEAARKGKLALPEFQRNFVWSRDDITELLVSVLQGHFIGSFLLLNADSDNVPFAVRPLQGVHLAAQYLRPDTMILDGQQRLTALHYAFAAPDIPLKGSRYPYRFFLDLTQVTLGRLEDAIFSDRAAHCDGMLDRRQQFATLIVPLTEMEQWDKWLLAYEQWLVNQDRDKYFNQYFPIDKPRWSALMDRIKSFVVPTITIPRILPSDPEGVAEVCAMFEKMNSTGIKLSVYDLLTARLHKDGIYLHKLWEEAIDAHHLLDTCSEGSPDEFGVYTLRTIALLRGLDVRSKNLINLRPEHFVDDWNKAVTFMERALDRITSTAQDGGFGAFERKWVPYITMVSPLAAMLHAIDDQKLDDRAYRLMKRWYWSAIFRERYAGAVETAIYRDYQDFLRVFREQGFEPEVIREARTSIVESRGLPLQEINRLNSVYRGVMCLIALRGAKDFRTGDSIEFHDLEDHHVFPTAYLAKPRDGTARSTPLERVNCVVNRTLISDRTNKMISGSSPKDYLRQVVPADKVDSIMGSHFIQGDTLGAMLRNDFEGFLEAREKLLLDEISRRINGD